MRGARDTADGPQSIQEEDIRAGLRAKAIRIRLTGVAVAGVLTAAFVMLP